MKKTFTTTLLIALLAVFGCVGCEGPTETASEPGTHTHADGTVHSNDHGGGGHGESGHSHDNPPHGGTYVDWGNGKYHVEFTVNHDKQEATVYILGDDAVTALPIDATEIQLAINEPKFQIALKATPMDGEAEGVSSRFVGTHEGLGVVREYEGTIFGNTGGKQYSGVLKELPHKH